MKASMVLTDRDPLTYWPLCEHGDGELRTYVYANGIKHYVFECQTCGCRSGSIKRAHWLIASLTSDPPAIDPAISERYWQKQRDARVDAFEQRRIAYREVYLQSDEWRRKSNAVLFRDRGLCQAMLDGCDRLATEVHHLTYKHIGNEPLFDLVSVCRSCHEQLSDVQRDEEAA